MRAAGKQPPAGKQPARPAGPTIAAFFRGGATPAPAAPFAPGAPPAPSAPSASSARPRRQESQAEAAARLIFGHSSLRPKQDEAVRAAVAGHDCFVLLPTGGGKSLCYQLPAVLSAGVTVVVSPLLALIEDQVGSLVKARGDAEAGLRGVPATYLSSASAAGHSGHVFDDLSCDPPLTKLLYVTPEMLMHNVRLTPTPTPTHTLTLALSPAPSPDPDPDQNPNPTPNINQP